MARRMCGCRVAVLAAGAAAMTTASAADPAPQPPVTRDEIAAAVMRPYEGPLAPGVVATSLNGRVLCGYQGWFAMNGDCTGRFASVHQRLHRQFDASYSSVDVWPDLEGFPAEGRFPTGLSHADGRTAEFFSAYRAATVVRHFAWMKEHGIDGVFLQRFGGVVRSPQGLLHNTTVMANVQAGANLHGRTWALMYDLTGMHPGDIRNVVMPDWRALVEKRRIREDPTYLRHRGRPVIAVWGVGFGDDRRQPLTEYRELVEFLKRDPVCGGNTVMLGVPTGWRSLDRDAVKDPMLHEIVRMADIVSPWTVGRYRDPAGARRHVDHDVVPDLAWCRAAGLDYMPVAFPGFSWVNKMKRENPSLRTRFDDIPRLDGAFFWSQLAGAARAGCSMVYVAMFDEVDEGTAIFRISNDPPAGPHEFVKAGAVPPDHYMRVAGEAGRMLRGERPVSDVPPAPIIPKPAAAAAPQVKAVP